MIRVQSLSFVSAASNGLPADMPRVGTMAVSKSKSVSEGQIYEVPKPE